MNKFAQLLVIPLTFISLVSCTGSKPVATVGSSKITKDDVGMRLSIMKVFNPQMNEKMAMEQLIRSATLVEILNSKGMKISDQMVEMEVSKLRGATKGNPKIETMMKEFGSKKKFKDVYIVPSLVEGMAFRDGFQKDEAFHKAENEKVASLLAAVKNNPSKLEETAKQMAMTLKKGTIREKDGLTWEGSDRDVAHMPALPAGPGFGQYFKKNFLEKVPSGKVSPSVENFGQFMAVIRNDGGSKDSMKFSIALVTRRNFGEWFNENSKNVKVMRVEEKKAN